MQSLSFIHRHNSVTQSLINRYSSVTQSFIYRHNSVTQSLIHRHNSVTQSLIHRHNSVTQSFIHRHNSVTQSFIHRHNSVTQSFIYRYNSVTQSFIHRNNSVTQSFIHRHTALRWSRTSCSPTHHGIRHMRHCWTNSIWGNAKLYSYFPTNSDTSHTKFIHIYLLGPDSQVYNKLQVYLINCFLTHAKTQIFQLNKCEGERTTAGQGRTSPQ